MSPNNQQKPFAEVVSLDAWHERFSAKCKTADLHVDIAFTTGRIGDAPDSKVRFRLCLKRAEAVVILPKTEPAEIVKKSVSRDAVQKKVSKTEIREREVAFNGELNAKVGLKNGLTSNSFAVSGSLKEQNDVKNTVKTEEQCNNLQVTQVMTVDGDYAWLIEPSEAGTLEGRPWDATKQPRLRVTDTRRNSDKGISPVLRVELRCRREDMVITDIVLKNKTIWSRFEKRQFYKNRLIAAEAYIRTLLFESGLLHGEIDDPYALVTLSALVAEGQQ